MILKLSEKEFQEASEVITSIIGINFLAQSNIAFSRNLAAAAEDFGFDNFSGFIKWLEKKSLDWEQKSRLGKHFTITETYFWREPATFNALVSMIIPELVKKKQNQEKKIRIWSAGCSSGEEPYSLAMAMMESIPDIDNWDIKILASDINNLMLNRARKGIYGIWSFRNPPEFLMSKYFKHIQQRNFQVVEKVKELVEFKLLNLADSSHMNFENEMDIIFCRNVLMYFREDLKQNCIKSFYKSLKEEGWFVVSSCELSSDLFSCFSTVNFSGSVMYRKISRGNANTYDLIEVPNGLADNTISGFDSAHLNLSRPVDACFFAANGELSSSDLSVKTALNTINQESIMPPKPGTDNLRPDIISNDPSDREMNIYILAGSGELDKALEACEEAISASKLDPRFYYIKASILQELGKIYDALKSLRQLLYIDPSNAMGHFITGYIFMKLGDQKRAKTHYRNVLDLTKNMDENLVLPYSEGLSVGHIRNTISSGIPENLR